MDTRTTIGVLAGLIGLALGLAVPFAIWRGAFSRWMAIRPARAVAACDAAALRARLLALDDASQPFRYTAGPDGAIVAEWRIADASWTQFFAKFKVTEMYRATLVLSAPNHEVRVLEQRSGTRSGPGEYSTHRFQGVALFDRSWHREWALAGPSMSPREVVNYDFDVRRIKAPLINAALEAGWTWVPVISRSQLATRRALA